MIKKLYLKCFPGLAQELKKAIGNSKTLLDIGCGSSSPLKYIDYRGTSTGIDGFKPSLKKSKSQRIHSNYILMDIKNLDKKFKKNQFDCVIAMDVIEHFKKKDANKLIKNMERIAKEKIIIFTPNGFLNQGAYEGNLLQIHKSGWSSKEMIDRGYAVIGIHGWKKLRGEYSNFKFGPYFLWRLISDITQKLTRNHPKNAFAILCVKVQKKE